MKRGFTLIELIVVISILTVVSAMATINLVRPQSKASVDTAATTLVSDLKQQQLKAMAGDGEGSAAETHGIYFESNRYTLFKGTYSAGNSNNFVVDLDSNLSLSTAFPSTQVVFSRRSGEVSGFASGSDTVTVSDSGAGESKVITVNRYGVVTVN